MPIDLEKFAIDRVIIHEMPNRPPKALLKKEPELDVQPDLSTAETDLHANERLYLENKIKVSLNEGAHAARFISAADKEPVPTCLRSLLTSDDPDLIPASHEMAMALHNAEHGGTSEGLFVVALGTRKKDRMVTVIKLEKEQGVRLHRNEAGGLFSINLIVERELVLGEGTKIFKAGVFLVDDEKRKRDAALDDDAEAFGPEIWVSDEQRRGHTSKVVADFYLRKFLRCEPLRSPAIHTAEFFEMVDRWVNDNVEDPVRQTKYQQALLSELNSEKRSIKPSEFIRDHVEEEDRRPLGRVLRDHDLHRAFRRDIALIEPKIQQLSWRFASGVRVLATQEQYDDVISMTNEGAKARLTIVDKLKNVGAS